MPNISRRFATWSVLGLVVLVICLWMASGTLKKPGERSDAETATAQKAQATAAPGQAAKSSRQAAAPAAVQLETQVFNAQRIERTVEVAGDTAPSRSIDLAAQAEGQVVAVLARKGARVKAGEEVVRLDGRDLELHRAQALAALQQADLENRAAAKLRETGHVTEGELAAKFALLQARKASVADAEFQLTHRRIRAPMAAVVEEQPVEVGNYVRVGQMVLKLLVTDPLLIRINVSEADVSRLQRGASAQAVIAGQSHLGTVEFISAMADSNSRTFAVDVRISNPGSKLPAGLSASVRLPVGEVPAHRLAASLLSLSDDGVLGIRHVAADRRVQFAPVTMIKAEGDSVWVSGLPERIEVITKGQGFVDVGATVPPSALKTDTGANAVAKPEVKS